MANAVRMSRYVLEGLQNKKIDKEFAVSLIRQFNAREDIAIVGMGCVIPDAENYEQYWKLIVNRTTTIRRCSRHRIELIRKQFPGWFTNDECKYSKGSFFKDIDLFDPKFFLMSQEEASVLGPAHRLVLETVYRALEDAGFLGEAAEGNRTGIFIGNNFAKEQLYSYGRLELMNSHYQFRFEQLLGNYSSGLATRAAGIFDLRGGAYTIDASCPSSAIAVHNACMAIRSGQCTEAVAGGVLLDMVPLKKMTDSGWIFAHGDEVISRNYDFDTRGGYLGEGCGALLLKSLDQAMEDGDRIHGIICASAFSNNGASGSFTRSSAADIRKTVIEAVRDAQISAEDINYLEGEGYPVKMEEGIELSGLMDGFRAFSDKRQYCGLGSISPNFGYQQSAIGVLQLIKVLSAMEKEIMPPQCHFEEPTDAVNLMRSPFYVNVEPKPWTRQAGKSRYAATYSYGYGGDNVFIVVKEASERKRKIYSDTEELFVLTAATKKSFYAYIEAYIQFLSSFDADHEDSGLAPLAEICYTAAVCRELRSEFRLAVLADSRKSLYQHLINFTQSRQDPEHIFVSERTEAVKHRKHARQSTDGKSLKELAVEFCNGENFIFKELYEDRKVSKCELPPYPFDKVYCWMNDDGRQR